MYAFVRRLFAVSFYRLTFTPVAGVAVANLKCDP